MVLGVNSLIIRKFIEIAEINLEEENWRMIFIKKSLKSLFNFRAEKLDKTSE